MILQLSDTLNLEVFNDSNYTLNFSDNVNQYDKIFLADSSGNANGCRHGLRIFDDKNLIQSCAVHAFAGATSVSKTSMVCEEDRILLCCSNHVFCISIPNLDLIWNTEVEWATAFQIFRYENDYIVHGETEIVRIDANGKIIWTFGGADIFVSPENTIQFRMEKGHMEFHDFIGNLYRIDYNGQSI